VSVHPVDDAGPLDFRSPRELGDAVLDHCFTDLERDEDGLARVRLDTAGGGPQASLWVDASFDYLMLFTGDTLAPDARRRGLAIEPMTCPANALQSGEGLVRLAPGASFSGRWGISQSG
jgi:aldose 1-epimerase